MRPKDFTSCYTLHTGSGFHVPFGRPRRATLFVLFRHSRRRHRNCFFELFGGGERRQPHCKRREPQRRRRTHHWWTSSKRSGPGSAGGPASGGCLEQSRASKIPIGSTSAVREVIRNPRTMPPGMAAWQAGGSLHDHKRAALWDRFRAAPRGVGFRPAMPAFLPAFS